MKKTIPLLLLAIFSSSLFSQTADEKKKIEDATVNLYSQLIVNPQEKIYVQTDRPYYIMGEKIHFRSFLLDAAKLTQATYSRYIYVEVISPFDEVIVQQKIRLDDKNMFYGSLQLPEFMAEGNYLIRAYTRYMENAGKDFFFTRPVFVANPNADKVEISYDFDFNRANNVGVNLEFIDKKTNQPIAGKDVELLLQTDKKEKTQTIDNNGKVKEQLKLNKDEARRTLLVSYKDGSNSFSKYISINHPDAAPEIHFFPEGGQLVAGKENRVAFKAISPHGKSTTLQGEIINSKAEVVAQFATTHEGMGLVQFTPMQGETYSAKATVAGETVTAKLPEAKLANLALQANWENEQLRLKLIHNEISQPYYLLIHRHGVPLYFEEWSNPKEDKTWESAFFKTGVSHVLLLNKNFEAVSERLVFNNLNDEIKVHINTDKNEYKSRELVKMNFELKSIQLDSIPADFAVSVLDSEDVSVDRTTNIMAEILLTSELKGTIINPAWYFSEDEKAFASADLLMLTHGWRKYHVKEALKNDLIRPEKTPEISQSFEGILTRRGGKPYPEGVVKMTAVGHDFAEAFYADENGRFRFDNFEFPDSTAYQFVAAAPDRSGNVEVHIDKIDYPLAPEAWFAKSENDNVNQKSDIHTNYITKATRRYIQENGMLYVDLDELTITARARVKREELENNTIPTRGDFWISPTQLENDPAYTFEDLFWRIPSVESIDFFTSTSGAPNSQLGPSSGVKLYNHGYARFILDGIERDFIDITGMIDVSDIGQVDVYTTNQSVIMRWQPPAPVIMLTTWPSSRWKVDAGGSEHIKLILPIGYQMPDEFYAPKYDTPEALANSELDLRSTIYWVPNILLNGYENNSIEFYTADKASKYNVVIEGIAPGRRFISTVVENAVEVKE